MKTKIPAGKRGKTKMARMIDYLNRYTGKTIARVDLLKAIDGPSVNLRKESSTDHYRRSLELAGYISKHPQPGLYFVELKIPIDLTIYALNKSVKDKRGQNMGRE